MKLYLLLISIIIVFVIAGGLDYVNTNETVTNPPALTTAREAYRINVYCDKETGVEYLLNTKYRAGGLTPRYNLDGTLRGCK